MLTQQKIEAYKIRNKSSTFYWGAIFNPSRTHYIIKHLLYKSIGKTAIYQRKMV